MILADTPPAIMGSAHHRLQGGGTWLNRVSKDLPRVIPNKSPTMLLPILPRTKYSIPMDPLSTVSSTHLINPINPTLHSRSRNRRIPALPNRLHNKGRYKSLNELIPIHPNRCPCNPNKHRDNFSQFLGHPNRNLCSLNRLLCNPSPFHNSTDNPPASRRRLDKNSPSSPCLNPFARRDPSDCSTILREGRSITTNKENPPISPRRNKGASRRPVGWKSRRRRSSRSLSSASS